MCRIIRYLPTSWMPTSKASFSWELAARAKLYGPVILAGGLTPENIEIAIAQVRPYGVDVSSGVERAPGVKDHQKVRQFIACAKAAALAETGPSAPSPMGRERG